MTHPTNKDIAEALRSITDLPLGTSLILRLAANRLDPPVATAEECGDPDDGWVKWSGAEYPPIKLGTAAQVQYRSGEIRSTKIGDIWSERWSHLNNMGDIVAYRILK